MQKKKRPKSSTKPLSLKTKQSSNIIPLHITFKNSQRTFAEASGKIIINSAFDYDNKQIFEGINLNNFLNQLNLDDELEVCINV